MARIHRRTIQNSVSDLDNYDGVITHQEPDIIECEVKWALGSITMNKVSRGDRIPAELFQIVKDNAVKVLHSICQQIWKTQQWPQEWKKSVSFQSQRVFELSYSDLKVSPKLQLCLHQPDRKLASAKKKNKAREGDRRVLEEEAVALYRLTLLRR